jgi:hypothetical protein
MDEYQLSGFAIGDDEEISVAIEIVIGGRLGLMQQDRLAAIRRVLPDLAGEDFREKQIARVIGFHTVRGTVAGGDYFGPFSRVGGDDVPQEK